MNNKKKYSSVELAKHADIISKLELLNLNILKLTRSEFQSIYKFDQIKNNISNIRKYIYCPLLNGKEIECKNCIFRSSENRRCVCSSINNMPERGDSVKLYEEAIEAIKFLIKYREEFIQDND